MPKGGFWLKLSCNWYCNLPRAGKPRNLSHKSTCSFCAPGCCFQDYLDVQLALRMLRAPALLPLFPPKKPQNPKNKTKKPKMKQTNKKKQNKQNPKTTPHQNKIKKQQQQKTSSSAMAVHKALGLL